MDDPRPVRITYSQGRAEAVTRAFISGFWVFAAIFAAAAFWRPALIPFSIGFPVYLVVWSRQIRRAPRPGWALVVSEDGLALDSGETSRSIPRAAAGRVLFHRRSSGRSSWTELRVINESGRVVFREGIDEPDRKQLAEALRSKGWPLEA